MKIETEIDDNAADSAVAVAVPAVLKNSSPLIPQPPPPSLSVKEKKDLASYAHSLGKKLKSQQVGKSGVTDTVVMALIETLEANELLKVNVILFSLVSFVLLILFSAFLCCCFWANLLYTFYLCK